MLILAGITLQSNAQEKGQFWIGGSLGFANEKYDNYQNTDKYSFYPEFGYAFSDNWAIGIRLEYYHLKTDQTYSLKHKEDNYSVSPFVRYTCFTWKAFSVFVDSGISYFHKKNKQENTDYDYYYHRKATSNGVGLFIQPGFSLRLSNCISLIGHLDFFNADYSKTKYKGANYDHKEDYSAKINSPFNLNYFTVGFNFKF